MFYNIEILRRRGGRFGTVWLAATNQKALNKRDYYAVNVAKTGEDLRTFIIGQVASRHEGGHKFRFSLYLSSQLMFGIIRVYQRQAAYLLDELLKLAESLRGPDQRKSRGIDLNTSRHEVELRHVRNDHTLPALNLEIDPTLMDIEFGLFNIMEPIPPEDLPDVCVWPPFDSPLNRHRGTEKNISFIVSPIDLQKGLLNQSNRFQASRDEITIREDVLPALASFEIPEAEDLPVQDEREVAAALVDAGIAEELFSSVMPSAEPSKREKKQDKTQSIIDPEAVEEPQRPRKRRKDQHKDVETTPGMQQIPPPQVRGAAVRLELSPVVEVAHAVHPPHPRSRQRHRLVVDTQTKIDVKLITEHLRNTQPTLRSTALEHLVFAGETVDQMFHQPARKDMKAKELVQLWKKCAFTLRSTTLDEESSSLSAESTFASFPDASRISPPAAVVMEEGLPEGVSVMSIEKQREASSLAEDRNLSRTDASGVKSGRPSSAKSLSAETSLIETVLEKGTTGQQSELAIVEEMPEDLPDAQEPVGLAYADMIRSQLEAFDGDELTFEKLCPLNNYADVAAAVFLAVLGGAAEEKWEAVQSETLGEIQIHAC